MAVVCGGLSAEELERRLRDTVHVCELDNVAVGVPMAWYDSVMTIGDHWLEAWARFVIGFPKVTGVLANRLVGLVRETCVEHAFDTHGTVDQATGWVVDEFKTWDMKASFNDKLSAITDEIAGDGATDSHKDDMRSESRSLVEELMYKRSKGPRHPRTVLHNGRNFVFIFYNNNSAGTWFDVSLKNCTMCCHVCKGFDSMQCCGCGEVRYCSTGCQRWDWDAGHKEACRRKAES